MTTRRSSAAVSICVLAKAAFLGMGGGLGVGFYFSSFLTRFGRSPVCHRDQPTPDQTSAGGVLPVSSKPSASMTTRSSYKVATYIADSLANQGVRHVFGGHGGSVIPLVNAVASHKKLNWVYTRNEQAASLAAAASAKLTGRVGVCIATSGPGASNLVTGLIDAVQDRVPCLAITGMKATHAVDLSEFQSIHQEEVYRAGGVQFSRTIMSEDAIPGMLRNALTIAMREKTAVHLALPVDLQSKDLSQPGLEALSSVSHLEYQASEARIEHAAQVIADPQIRVVIALGHRAASALPAEFNQSVLNPYVRLAETLNAPIITQLDAKGCVDEAHPLSYGVLGIFGNPGLDAARTVVNSADVVLLFGVDQHAVDLIADSNFRQVRTVVEFEPDAGSAAFHRWYDCEAVVLGDLAANARRLEASVSNLRSSPGAMQSKRELEDLRITDSESDHWAWLLRGGWRGRVEPVEDQASRPSRFIIEHEEREGYCHPARVLHALGSHLRPGDIVAVDTGDVRATRPPHSLTCPPTKVELTSPDRGTLPSRLGHAVVLPEPLSLRRPARALEPGHGYHGLRPPGGHRGRA